MAPSEQLPRTAEDLAVAALTLAGFAIALNVQVLAALGPFLGDALQIDEARFGRIVSSGWIGGAIGALAVVWFVDRVSRRDVIVAGTALFSVATLGHLFVESADQLQIVRTVAGLAGGVVFTVSSAAIADLVPYVRRGRAMGIFNLSIFLAFPVGMPLATLFADLGSWRMIFGVQVAFAVLAVVGVLKTMPRALGRGGERLQWRVMTAPGVIPALLSVVLYSGAFATSVQFLGVWLHQSGVVPRGEQWQVWVLLGIVSALGTVGLTRFSDVIGKRPFVIVTSVVVGTGFALLPSAATGVGGLVWIGVPIALCTAARSGAMLALISGLTTSARRGSLMALRSVAVSAGMGAIVYAGGEVYAAFDYSGVLWLAAGSVGLSMVCVLFVREGDT